MEGCSSTVLHTSPYRSIGHILTFVSIHVHFIIKIKYMNIIARSGENARKNIPQPSQQLGDVSHFFYIILSKLHLKNQIAVAGHGPEVFIHDHFQLVRGSPQGLSLRHHHAVVGFRLRLAAAHGLGLLRSVRQRGQGHLHVA